jgi:hypothetical protein
MRWTGGKRRGTASPRSDGGTANVVAYAREHGTPVRVIWPRSAHCG